MVTKKDEGRGKEEGGGEERGFRRLVAWQKADRLASEVYQCLQASQSPPWLASQAMRAAISVPANMAEGYSRGSIGDYLRFLDYARGSLGEVESYIDFMRTNGVLSAKKCDGVEQTAWDAGNLLVGLIRSLRAKQKDGSWDRIAEEQAEYVTGSENHLPSSSNLLPGGDRG